jgi:hypothetical protein
VVLGFYPQPVISTARQAVTAVQRITAGSALTPGPLAEKAGPAQKVVATDGARPETAGTPALPIADGSSGSATP